MCECVCDNFTQPPPTNTPGSPFKINQYCREIRCRPQHSQHPFDPQSAYQLGPFTCALVPRKTHARLCARVHLMMEIRDRGVITHVCVLLICECVYVCAN